MVQISQNLDIQAVSLSPQPHLIIKSQDILESSQTVFFETSGGRGLSIASASFFFNSKNYSKEQKNEFKRKLSSYVYKRHEGL